MAIYCELNTVTQHINSLKELYISSSKNEAQAQVHNEVASSSPLRDWMGYTRSLDQTPVISSKKPEGSGANAGAASQSSQASDPKGAAGASDAAKKKTVESIKWKAHVAADGEKSPFRIYDVIEPLGESLLSSVITPAKQLTFKVHFNLDGSVAPGGPLSIRVSDSETLQSLIHGAIQKYTSESRSPPLPTEDVTAYLLRLAESDGSIDNDVPALNANAGITTKWGIDFVLTRNPKYEFAGSKGAASASKLMIIVHLPDNQKATYPLASNTEAKVIDLIRKVCDRRLFNVADYHVRRLEESSPLPSEMSLNDLGTTEVRLCSNTELSTNTEAEEEDVEFWSEVRAFTYKQYPVNLVKRRFMMEERELGIDSERIKIEKKKGSSAKRQEIKRFAELKSITGNDKNPKSFTIEWSDGKTEHFEAQTPRQAREIIGKISYIKERRAQ